MNLLQIKASNPHSSSWVSASAGTGKTKILTDRFLRLLLTGQEMHKILCLTFTNAGANEMHERIIKTLQSWYQQTDAELCQTIANSTGETADNATIKLARDLYQKYLNAKEKLNIHTIHSFCQKILKLFPIEAELNPNFAIMTDIQLDFIWYNIKNDLYADPNLSELQNYLLTNLHELTIDKIIQEIIEHKVDFSDYQHNLPEPRLADHLLDTDFEQLLQHALIKQYLPQITDITQLKEYFFTKQNQPRARLALDKELANYDQVYAQLQQLQHVASKLLNFEKEQYIYDYSKLLNYLAVYVLQRYEHYKAQQNLLDYDDLITYTLNLLQNNQHAQWVLYKLDGGIDHLLVDEAQDTSTAQWQIVEALIAEFYAGLANKAQVNRTLFVVGDEKQSIFSFQGANLERFFTVKDIFAQRLKSANKSFHNIALDISYRSTKELLEFTQHLFSYIDGLYPNFVAKLQPLKAFRSGAGLVELWPLVKYSAPQPQFFCPEEIINQDSAQKTLARQISHYISELLAQQNILPSTGQAVKPTDVMILFRTRDDFTTEVIQALQHQNIPISGLDRIALKDNLAVLDLLAIAKFVLNPEDDLNLAAILNSPIIDCQKTLLPRLRQESCSLWQAINMQLPETEAAYQTLQQFLTIYYQHPNHLFFHYIVDLLNHRSQLNQLEGFVNNDAIDELLNIYQKFIQQNSYSLQNFVFWFENNNLSIKRETNKAAGIQLMTLHGAKGLQAPIVIMCDTTSLPHDRGHFLWTDEGCYAQVNTARATEQYQRLKDLANQETYAEYLRLLYVGVTRAKDQLIICGFQSSKSIAKDCWYELVKNSIDNFGRLDEDGVWRYGHKIAGKPQQLSQDKHLAEKYFSSAPLQLRTLQSTETPTKGYSPFVTSHALEYGLVFHKLLELTVKDIASLTNRTPKIIAQQLQAMQQHPLINSLQATNQQRILAKIAAIADNREFIELLQHPLKSELSIGSKQVTDNHFYLGRIDLLVQLPTELIIIDYKTDLFPANNHTEVAEKYLQQLICYEQVVKRIYPNKQIQKYILWLENARLMLIDHCAQTSPL